MRASDLNTPYTTDRRRKRIGSTMDLAEQLSAREYIRQRLNPYHGDEDYLVLSDLTLLMRHWVPSGVDRVLDYGCGGSPYRSLFSASTYHRADLSGGADLDFAIDASGRLPVSDSTYEFVLSSQVLEHVPKPEVYLSECFRVLEPGGSLLVTTHGSFWDHACPDDYWRWTARGLKQVIEAAGFATIDLKKTTVGTRAALYMLERQIDARTPMSGWREAFLSIVSRAFGRRGAARRHQIADTCLSDFRVVDATSDDDDGRHAFYVGVAILARRPIA